MRNRQVVLAVVAAVVLIAAGIAAFMVLQPPAEQAVSDLDAIQAELDAGDYASARDQLSAMLEENESDAEAHFKLGLAYFNLGDYTQARTHFLRSGELDPERASAVHHNLGVLALQSGDMETALAEFEAALETDPDDVDTHYQMGATYLLLAFPTGALEPDPSLLEKAEVEFERALELAPDKPEAMVGLANVAMLSNNIEASIDLLEKAVELQPNMREALFALGRVYAMVGRADEAESTLRQFLETDPPEMWAQQAEQILGELSGD